ncbi:restriction endonuclease subunit S [Staphylococcus equorum]|uniref:restriction endonuclease subunit S n=1 Tax=Staphylococcus equorum TaxID=246432 RepID=UPI002553F848|nr:restriction endonuclease subunit S [Staphylococcus equorum]MDK9850612.1 restriction endonuclease subunit S [Staphylococcus equorum]
MTNEIKNVPKLRFPEYSEEWEKKRLKDISKINPKLMNEFPSEFDYIDLESVYKGKINKVSRVTNENAPSRAQRVAQRGDVFFQTVRPYQQNNFVFLDDRYSTVVSTGYAQIRSNMNSFYIYNLLLTSTFLNKVLINCTGSNYPAINSNDLGNISIRISTNENEKQKIGEFFSKLDRQIELEEQKLSLLEEQKKGYMQQIFSQKLRFKNEVGKNYSEWKHETLNELNCYFTDGNYGESYPKSDDMSNFEEGVAFLRGSNIKKGRIVLDNANYISKEKHNELVSGHLYLGDIVIAVRGSLGAVGYVEKNIEGQNINSQLAIIRTLDTKIVSRFLIYYLMSNFGQKELLSKVSGTALKQLPLKQIKSFKTPLPENKEQDKISDFFYKLDKIINKQIKKIDRLKLRKKGFLQKMFV